MNVYNKFHGNPSNSYLMSLQTTSVNFKGTLVEKSVGYIEWKQSKAELFANSLIRWDEIFHNVSENCDLLHESHKGSQTQ